MFLVQAKTRTDWHHLAERVSFASVKEAVAWMSEEHRRPDGLRDEPGQGGPDKVSGRIIGFLARAAAGSEGPSEAQPACDARLPAFVTQRRPPSQRTS